jgi:hypothetical protein
MEGGMTTARSSRLARVAEAIPVRKCLARSNKSAREALVSALAAFADVVGKD